MSDTANTIRCESVRDYTISDDDERDSITRVVTEEEITCIRSMKYIKLNTTRESPCPNITYKQECQENHTQRQNNCDGRERREEERRVEERMEDQ
jgi:hypothetical protein